MESSQTIKPSTIDRWKVTAIVFIVLSFVFVGLSTALIVDKFVNNNSDDRHSHIEDDNQKMEDDDNVDDKWTGFSYKVKGFATQEDRCVQYAPDQSTVENIDGGIKCAETAAYVNFNILEANDEFKQWLEHWQGNSFAGSGFIGLGCVINGELTYWNTSDAYGHRQYILTSSDTNEILRSSKESPVTLGLTRLDFSGGSGAPYCSSHITLMNVL